MRYTSIRLSENTATRLEFAMQEIAKRGYVLRSKDDAINALLDLLEIKPPS